MKRTFTSYLVVLFTLLVTATTVNAQPVQSADRDKINSVVMNLLNEWDQQSFQNAAALISQVSNYDMTNVAIEGIQRLLGMKQAIEGTPDYRLFFSSKLFTGHFIVVDNKWVKESEADDLQFAYTAPTGVPCVLKLSTSGEVKTTQLPFDIQSIIANLMGGDDDDDWDDYEYDYSRSAAEEEDGSSMLNNVMVLLESFMEGVKLFTFEIPANTNVSLTYGGKPVVTIDLSADLSVIGQSLFDGLIFSANNKIYKGVLDNSGSGVFEFNITNTGYKPVSGVNLDFAAKKDNKQLVSFKVSMPGTFKGTDLQQYMTANGFDIGFQSLNIDIDVLGQAQLKGGIPDLNAFINLLVAADSEAARSEASEPDATYQAMLDMINQMVQINLYYDGSSTPAASVKLLPSYDAEYDEWESAPYIVFADNSKYELDEFFTVENFPEVAQGVMKIAGDVTQLVETVKESAKEQIQSVDNTFRPATAATQWYTIDGKRTTSAAKGLKIVRMSDGSVRKIMSK